MVIKGHNIIKQIQKIILSSHCFQQYIRYNICEIYTLCRDAEELSALKTELGGYENLFSAPSYKALTKLIFSNQTQTKLLLVSGHSSFTSEVRLEIVRKLQF